MSQGMAGPLSGIKVLDLGQIFQGPYATFLMAKAGADVVKVEPPGGEPARRRAQVNRGASLPFEMLNVNKRSLVLDLKSDRGRDLFLDLCRNADVLVENFAPGAMDRLGLGWETVSALNPRLIYASATGYGLDGPDRDKLAMDLTIQASSGVMACTGYPGGAPLKAGPAVVDFLGGVHLYAAVLTALVERGRTGTGRLVEIAMQEVVYPTLASTLGLMFEKGAHAVMRTGNRHSGLAQAPYNVYPASDGFMAIICVVDAHWTRLLRAIDREDLIDDPAFSTHAARVERLDETDAIIERWTRVRSKEEIAARLEAFQVPSAAVREMTEVIDDPHMMFRGTLERIDHPRLGEVVFHNSPLKIHGAPQVPIVPAPELGAHNDEVVAQWLAS